MMPAGAARRILLPFYPRLVREQEKAVTVAAKAGKFIAGETRKGQFLQGNRRNLPEERLERKISSPGSIADTPYLCNDRS